MVDLIKEFVNFLSSPTVSFTLLTVSSPFLFPPTDWFEKYHYKFKLNYLWKKEGGILLLVLVTLFLIAGYTDKYAVKILTKADNVPIVLMFYLVPGTLWLSMYQAYKNDERLEKGEAPDEYNDPKDKILVWPDLVYTELICLILFTVFLTIWSVYLPAPLEEPANPAATPNPSKAPWYFLGLQEMLVYFDPWIAGIMFPLLIIAGLCAIPYVDTNKRGEGYYSFKERRISIFIFMYGWLALWFYLIIVGTFFRGPNWNFYGPFEYWDSHKIEALSSINLSEYLWVKAWNQGLPSNILAREFLGIILVILYFMVPPALLAKGPLKSFYEELGPARYSVTIFFALAMLALPIKMYLRWTINLQYIVSIPEWFFNI
ncbi:MAG: cytochrome C [Candidatus Neomarinimicrobiota bacterium]|jgi:hypothetical protein|nr:cytochrome C [Candidatus Neomarinimicrobiota bacterium]|tara:strand:- start:900 stop:2018 length:1119 start_codon:yes stop_codon:yes gene_type:complete